MNRPKSQRRWVHDAATPMVSNGPRQESVIIHVSPCGQHHKTVSFTLQWWQVRDLLTRLRELNAYQVQRMRETAAHMEGYVK